MLKSFTKPFLKPCTPPGAWSHIVHSQRVMGGTMFGAIDDSFYFADGSHAGYSWHHGFWGLIDACGAPSPSGGWRKWSFRRFGSLRGIWTIRPVKSSVSLPVENRYSFTDLGELRWTWEIGNRKGEVKPSVAPWKTGAIEIPVPRNTPEGAKLIVRVNDVQGNLGERGIHPTGA